MNIESISYYLPLQRISTKSVFADCGQSSNDARIFAKLFGIEQIAVASPKSYLRSVGFMVSKLKFKNRPPDTLVFAHGFRVSVCTSRILSTIRAICPELNEIQHVYEIDSYNCVGVFRALQIARDLINHKKSSAVLIVAGDDLPDYPIRKRLIRGSTIMADGLVALIVDNEETGVTVRDCYVSGSKEYLGDMLDPERLRRLYSNHAELVTSALNSVGFAWDSDERIIPHNINTLAWQTFSRSCNFDMARIRLDLLPNIGHCCTVDPFIILGMILGNRTTSYRSATLLSVGIYGQIGACRVNW